MMMMIMIFAEFRSFVASDWEVGFGVPRHEQRYDLSRSGGDREDQREESFHELMGCG